jgi:AcrR family transcriptional regulator
MTKYVISLCARFDNLLRSKDGRGMNTTSSKHQRVIERATEVFCRYGFARTTMGDIAERCEISRPALYLLFPDKEAIFTAVVEQMDREKLASIRAELEHLKGLHAKLLHACMSWGCHGIDLAAAHLDAADLFDLRFPVVQQVYRNFQSVIVELISKHVQAARLKSSAEQTARVLVFGMRGLRETAADRRDMQNLITSLVEICVRAIER